MLDINRNEEIIMLTVKDCLTYHGKSLDQCQWVIDNFKNHPLYQDNEGVQVWVKASEEILKGDDDG